LMPGLAFKEAGQFAILGQRIGDIGAAVQGGVQCRGYRKKRSDRDKDKSGITLNRSGRLSQGVFISLNQVGD
jgi:hypothetical protein